MSWGLVLLYRCGKTWADFDGDDPVERRCSECKLDVLDFEAFTADERNEYLALAEVAGEDVCASYRHDGEPVQPCESHPDSRNPRRPITAIAGRVGRKEPSGGPSTKAQLDALVAREKKIAAARAQMTEIRETVRRRRTS